MRQASGGPRGRRSCVGPFALAVAYRPCPSCRTSPSLSTRSQNHTVKRALADPRLFSGIGNAYSDEILHRARLSPLLLTFRMSPEQAARLHAAAQATLQERIARLRAETLDAPEELIGEGRRAGA